MKLKIDLSVMKKLQLLLLLFFISISISFAQNGNNKEVTISTTAHCNSCEIKIGDAIKFQKGVKSYEFSEDLKLLTIKYKSDKISETKLKEIIAELGYLAKEEVTPKKCGTKSCCTKGKSCSKSTKTEQ